MKRVPPFVLLAVLLAPAFAWAHHGGVTLAAGQGSPIETNAPLTLPQGGFVLSARVEQVPWKKYSFADPENKTSATFGTLGVSYGIAPYLTGSLFVPYTWKRQDGFSTVNDIGDPRIQLNIGFNHKPGQGVSLNRADDTAVSMEGTYTTYFAFWFAGTVPLGEYKHIRPGETEPDKGMQTGFGSPAFQFGAAVARNVTGSFGLIADVQYDVFTKKGNSAGPDLQDAWKYGNELRLDLAGVCELYGKTEAFLTKVDGILELNFLSIARDELNGAGETASGGNILYLMPGMRFTFPALGNMNLGLGVKFPVWKNLNEQDQQQGSEGLERYRAIGTLTFFF
jgi:hypothetical protein